MTTFPVTDHCDGEVFFNPGPPRPGRGRLDLLRWRLSGGRVAWPDWVADPAYSPPPNDVAPGKVAITFLGHASFLLTFAGLTVLTDPVFSQRCSPVTWAGPKRHRAPGLPLQSLPPINLVLLSHNHYDHMDLATLRTLHARFNPQIVTTLGNAAALARAGIPGALELDWWGVAPITGATLTATPARHFSARTPFDRNRTLWAGFMVQSAGPKLFFAGDSGAGEHWSAIQARLGAPDIALLPIGAYDPSWMMQPVHMNPAEAVAAHDALGARQSIGMHFGTFHLTDEAIDAPVTALEAARGTRNFDVLGCGETRIF